MDTIPDSRPLTNAEDRGLRLTLTVNAGIRAASIVAEQIRAMLESKRFGGKGEHASASVTISIGVAEARPGDTITSLMGRADAALYHAKATGRNRVCDEASVAA